MKELLIGAHTSAQGGVHHAILQGQEIGATTVQLLSFMSEHDWQREGTHTESGMYTPEHWLKIYAAHAHNHAAQIKRLKETLNT